MLFAAMPGWRVLPSVVTFNATISACEKCGEWMLGNGKGLPEAICPMVVEQGNPPENLDSGLRGFKETHECFLATDLRLSYLEIHPVV